MKVGDLVKFKGKGTVLPKPYGRHWGVDDLANAKTLSIMTYIVIRVDSRPGRHTCELMSATGKVERYLTRHLEVLSESQ